MVEIARGCRYFDTYPYPSSTPPSTPQWLAFMPKMDHLNPPTAKELVRESYVCPQTILNNWMLHKIMRTSPRV